MRALFCAEICTPWLVDRTACSRGVYARNGEKNRAVAQLLAAKSALTTCRQSTSITSVHTQPQLMSAPAFSGMLFLTINDVHINLPVSHLNALTVNPCRSASPSYFAFSMTCRSAALSQGILHATTQRMTSLDNSRSFATDGRRSETIPCRSPFVLDAKVRELIALPTDK